MKYRAVSVPAISAIMRACPARKEVDSNSFLSTVLDAL
jgi:hypothetical protein